MLYGVSPPKKGSEFLAETHVFTKGEEIANAITHGIGAVLSIAGLVILIVYSSLYGTAWHVVSFTIFGVTMITLCLCSTMLPALPKGTVKDLFEIYAHSAIYLFIAASYILLTFIVLKGALGWSIFVIIWCLAIGGIVFKAFFVKRYLFTSTILYIAMGWMIVLGWNRIVGSLNINGLILLVVGGVCYTFAAVFYMWRGFKYHHALWHLFVLAGTTAHFFCILFYILPL